MFSKIQIGCRYLITSQMIYKGKLELDRRKNKYPNFDDYDLEIKSIDSIFDGNTINLDEIIGKLNTLDIPKDDEDYREKLINDINSLIKE